ncbi:PAS domain-containing protein [Geobacter sp. AOG1]|uniref:PAS domain-containing protein n=1 Tax=Geobacter sp. AOG1 TaxID=1566346 RepID=UPI001CC6CEA8|nr:PAS domain-containing protein [Geobacter sp. AOG1]
MMNETETHDMLRAVFDVLPSMVFVVDEDVKIQEYNAAAAELLVAGRTTILKQRAGDILHCVHSHDVPEGCGRAPSCKDCIIRNSVGEAFRGNRVVRLRTKLVRDRDGDRVVMYTLITASPFLFQGKPHALLVIEDISEIAELHRLIPICSVCRKVRDDKESWMQVEAYFKNSWDVDFTHGFCPDCLKIEMDRIARIKAERGAPAGSGTP